MTPNKTFVYSENYNYSAWVGSEGLAVDEFAYEWGFGTAVEVLLNVALMNECVQDVDTGKDIFVSKDAVVFPILFCARHHIELHLKMHILRIGALRDLKSEDLTSTHNLKALFTILVEVSNSVDSRLSRFVIPLTEYIHDYDDLDNTGQVFRYARDNNNVAHFSESRLIDLNTVKRRWGEMRNLMNSLYSLTYDVLAPEYEAGTFLPKFSRQEIVEFADRLPLHVGWGGEFSEIFAELKSEVMERKSLSSREFQKLINVIKEKSFISHLIGIEVPIPNLPVDVIERMLKVKVFGDTSILNGLEWHAVSGVYSCGQPENYPEEFYMYMSGVQGDELRYLDVKHVFRKVRWNPDVFLMGLKRLGQMTLAEEFKKISGEIYLERDAPRFPQGTLEEFYKKAR
ncbi:hypothetical protein K5D34_12830 [Pseudomonas cichorii]|nr:hypothetical protein [Pseudomonas cichorii]MBX8510562.1 hypothetical protein [Pseudomonas cichorii]MBX8525565.1 hypothetical protein [Pseudomonas cichorii]